MGKTLSSNGSQMKLAKLHLIHYLMVETFHCDVTCGFSLIKIHGISIITRTTFCVCVCDIYFHFESCLSPDIFVIIIERVDLLLSKLSLKF